MRIGVDATCWANRRGYGRHARSLLTTAISLDRSHCYVFFLDAGQDASDLPPGVEVVRVGTATPAVQAASSGGHRSLADLWAMSRALSAPGFDCLLFPTVYTYVPVFSSAYKIVVIHDVIPETFPEHVFPTATGRFNWSLKSLAARRQADLILTVSEYSRQGILKRFGERPERVKVVGEASDPVFRVLADAVPNPERLLVFVGGFSPHKNLLGLLEAFSRVIDGGNHSDSRLVLVGDYQGDAFHSCYRQVWEQASRPPLAGRVEFAGFLPDEDLVRLLNRATALVLPSFLEGFGLPAIEAAACGLPVIATAASPLPQLLGEGALFFDPHDIAALAQALGRVLDDPALRGRLRENGLRAAAALSWNRAAQDLVAILDQAAHQHAQAA